MSNKYSVENMKSDYQPRCEDTYITSQEETKDNSIQNDDYTYSSSEEDVPFVGTDTVPAAEKAAVIESKMKTVKLVATSALTLVNGKNIKVCHVTENGVEHRLICLMDKIKDSKFSGFESQLSTRVSSGKTLEFRAEVAEKGNDFYLHKFA